MVLVVTLGLATMVLTWMLIDESLVAAGGSLDDLAGFVLLDLALGLVAIALYPLRHRKPLLIVGIVVAASSLSALAAPAAALSIVSLATRRRRGEIIGIFLLFVAGVLANILLIPDPEALPWWQPMALGAVVGAILILIGLYIGGRRQLVDVLRERAESAEREHAAGVEHAQLAERSRIAREMHDTLAHRLSLVTLHAGAMEYRADLSQEQLREAAGVVRENAHLASSELRGVLGVLRDPESGRTAELVRPPDGTLDDVHLLVQESRQAGNPTSLTVTDDFRVDAGTLPTTTRRHLHRVIQEGLTNARKHAPGRPVEVDVTGRPGLELRVRIVNPLAVAPPRIEVAESGFGLTGLRERVKVADGELRAGETDGHFTLEAGFPWPT